MTSEKRKYPDHYYMDKPCVVCGTMMHRVWKCQKYCPDCQKYVKSHGRPETQTAKAKKSLSEVAARAKAAGMTYGKYVALHERGR